MTTTAERYAHLTKTVTFRDRGRDDDIPLHVFTGPVELDGKAPQGVVGWGVEFDRSEGTVVVLDVLAEFVQAPEDTEDGNATNGIIDGIAVLTPRHMPWIVVGSADPRTRKDPDMAVVRCAFFVGRVVFE